MRFSETPLAGLYLVDIEPAEDQRGFFARTWCEREFEAHDLVAKLAQASISFNRQRGTLRGMHWQSPPHAESKLVRCTRGAIFDVAVDLRQGSPTYMQWFGTELDEHNRRAAFVPKGFAHGFQTLTDDTEVFYQVSELYVPKSECGARYDDPSFGIEWPLDVTVISEKDLRWPAFEGARP